MSTPSTFILSPIRKIEPQNLQERFVSVGANTGNLIFIEALKGQLSYAGEMDRTYPNFESLKNASFVMPASNFIRHVRNDPWFSCFQKVIDKIDGNVTMAGLGAEASRIFDTPWKLVRFGLNKEQKRLFKTISEKAVSIGVRGEFTAECLELMGIKNYRIIGCPSFFNFLNGKFIEPSKPSAEHIQMTITPGSQEKNPIVEMGMRYQCEWVMQSPEEVIQYDMKEARHISKKWLDKQFPKFNDPAKLGDYAKQAGHFLWSIESWNEFYAEERITFAFGTRFHGNMAAFRHGVPALWIVHDKRTSELTRFLHLPCISLKEFDSIKHIEELMALCHFEETKEHYAALCRNYVEFLNENHLEHKFLI